MSSPMLNEARAIPCRGRDFDQRLPAGTKIIALGPRSLELSAVATETTGVGIPTGAIAIEATAPISYNASPAEVVAAS